MTPDYFQVGRSRRACRHVYVGTCPHQVLAATLTLFQPGGTYHAHCILMSPPSFESHRRACYFQLATAVSNKSIIHNRPKVSSLFDWLRRPQAAARKLAGRVGRRSQKWVFSSSSWSLVVVVVVDDNDVVQYRLMMWYIVRATVLASTIKGSNENFVLAKWPP